jgi:hypothetical protein
MSREISDTTWRDPIPPFSSPAAGAHLRCAVLADLPEAGRHALPGIPHRVQVVSDADRSISTSTRGCSPAWVATRSCHLKAGPLSGMSLTGSRQTETDRGTIENP